METPNIAPAEIGTRPPKVSFLLQNVPPPSPLYIAQDDTLNLFGFSSVTGLVAQISGRILRASDGVVIPFVFNMPSGVAGGSVAAQRVLTEGYLLSLMAVITNSSGDQANAYFITAWLQRGPAVNFVVFPPVAYLLSDFVSGTKTAMWPTGDLRSPTEGAGFVRAIVGTDPAAGVEISETVPLGFRWSLISVSATLVTDAVVQNRTPILIIDDGANILVEVLPSGVQPAALAVRWTWANFGNAITSTSAHGNAGAPLPYPMIGGYRFRTFTVGMDAGDNWGPPQYLVLQWQDF